jgi:hypothetical protein
MASEVREMHCKIGETWSGFVIVKESLGIIVSEGCTRDNLNIWTIHCPFLYNKHTYIKSTAAKLQSGPPKKTELQKGPRTRQDEDDSVHSDGDEKPPAGVHRGVANAYNRAETAHKASVESGLVKPL